ncbi:hypothetical protein OZ411_41780 [Bradyrhizobium sp. Arg237L]|uniref:hypothetical protein n=1 Tax=Bradyrhizobium sp. Arg237L TaxID=3003352 RepID=UPI00249DA490|nr:hypothetical protein [Bradyrhizobium sp. Arg237L]MDI4239323.1 hypothetical protein [Bradyrhizobium sp. Arg237L]
MSKRWGAILRGHDDDLRDWREMLKPPFDPWIEVHDPDHVLRSASLDGLTSAIEVRDRVVAHIERLNGTMSVMRDCEPLQFSGVAELAPDGKVHRTVFMEAAFRLRGLRIAAPVMTTGLDGKPAPQPPPRPSEAQNWSAIADNDEFLEDALMHFSLARPPMFWFEIYKALECLMDRSGGETAFLALGWAKRDDVKQLKQTANWSRHARRRFKKPSPATTEEEAKVLMRYLLRTAFETAAKSPPQNQD